MVSDWRYPDRPGFAHDETSRDAARLIEPTARKTAALILRTIERVGPSTCHEIEEILDLSHQSASARITKLFYDGKLVKTNLKRRTGSNRLARVYAIAPAGTPPRPSRRSELTRLRSENAEMRDLLRAIRSDGEVTLMTHDRIVTLLEKNNDE